MKDFPIVIVEDDKDDCEFLISALTGIGIESELRCFTTPIGALQYLETTTEKPYLIISDINMPLMNGFAFKRQINDQQHLNDRKIPFVFLSTTATAHQVTEAFGLCVQGFFQKPNNLDELKDIAKTIIGYWNKNKLPHIVN